MEQEPQVIALLGLGTIGLSFCALHLLHSHPSTVVRVHDPRPDLLEHVRANLPVYLRTLHDQQQQHANGTTAADDDAGSQEPPSVDSLLRSGKLTLCPTLESACAGEGPAAAVVPATIIQEQGPENLAFKRGLWAAVAAHASPSAHLWSSTSGIFASLQTQSSSPPGPPSASSPAASAAAATTENDIATRLLVVHPFNPPHILPLLEIVPSPQTSPAAVSFAKAYFSSLGSGHRPVVLSKETTGFVGNRLAFALLREAAHLVSEGVVSTADLDAIVESGMGPRWAVAGPFRTYHLGGGKGGIAAFLDNLGGTIGSCWDDAGAVRVDDEGTWKAEVVRQTEEAYGPVDEHVLAKRDADLIKVVQAQPKK
ncbi:hypothetical protein N3K66_007849 [Trichothecium roseum]|uniref:Uncharacterized protein n=1 Tax=Trichothecium roseum TaxID=47278 RepID=A0ACC0USA4_9HYPO|nr:hypothetical protein N3K66_007849 [Trichothecium roseum]